MNDKCMYCGYDYYLATFYLVREAIKPKGYPFRWKTIGVCCEDCFSFGKAINIDKYNK